MFGKSFLSYLFPHRKQTTHWNLILHWFKPDWLSPRGYILRPNVSTLLSSTFNQGWKPVSLSTPQRRPKSQTRWKHNVFIASVIEIQMTAILSNADSDVRELVDPCNTSLTKFFSQIRYIKVMLCCSFYIYNIPDMPWNAQMAFIF